MRLGDLIFLIVWTVVVASLGFLSFPDWPICFFVGCYLLTGSLFATSYAGRIRLLVGWLPAFFSERAHAWTCRGGNILEGRDE